MSRLLTRMLLFITLLSLTACTAIKNKGIKEDFEKDLKDFNRLVRWYEVEKAGMLYMEPEGRGVYLKTAEDIKRRAVSITDYRILTNECLPEVGSGDAVVEFDYYIMPSNRIKTLTYRQIWKYRELNEKKSWKITNSPLPAFD